MGERTEDEHGIERIPSGIAGLDTVLRGGFLKGGTYILQGVPGAGKTILGNQIVYHYAARGGRALYVTLLAESHARMLLHLSHMRWFDPSVIPQAVTYVSAFRILEEEGLRGLLAVIRREVQTHEATMVIVDGLVAAGAAVGSETELKKFIHELRLQVALLDCTAFLLTSAQGQIISPEHTMVDGMVELGDELFGFRSERALVVRKLRGSGFLRGRHPFRITDDGIVVYPRFEAQYARPSRLAERWRGQLSTGIERLDPMIGGGIVEGTTTGIVGSTGTGKTLLGLHFVAASSAAEPGLFFGFFEMPARLVQIAEGVGLDLGGAVARGDAEILWQAPTEDIMDAVAHRLMEAVRRRRVRRLVVDSLGGFIETAVQPSRMTRFFAALSNELRALGVTTIYTLETRDVIGTTLQIPVDGISSLIENLILLRYAEYRAQTHRVLSIMKARGSSFDPTLREFVIGNRGIDLADTLESAQKLLSGMAEEQPSPPNHSGQRRASRPRRSRGE